MQRSAVRFSSPAHGGAVGGGGHRCTDGCGSNAASGLRWRQVSESELTSKILRRNLDKIHAEATAAAGDCLLKPSCAVPRLAVRVIR